MTDSVRFYLDQHMSNALATGLRTRGIDVMTAQEAGHCGLSDPDPLAYAAAETRVLVTLDTDYFALHGAGASHTGIAWCPARKYSIGQHIDALVLIHAVLSAPDLANHVEYL